MGTVQTSVLRHLGEALVPEAPKASLIPAPAFASQRHHLEISTIGAATLEIPVALIRKFPGPEKE
jgi:hypothetical protein